jgi:uncharacterized repeat protein (TIGR01451 family)
VEQQVSTDCVDDEIRLPKIGIEKSLRSLVAEPGKDVEFEIVVTNLSEVTAYTITIEDKNPDGFIYIKDSERSRDIVDLGLDDIQPLVWVLEDLEPGESIRFTYKAHIDPRLEEGLYHTEVKVYAMDRSGYQFETNEFELDVKVERAILLNITQQLPVSGAEKGVQAGEPLTIQTIVENIGSDGLIDSAVVVTLPDGFAYLPNSSYVNNILIGEPLRKGQTFTWKFGELPPDIKKTLTYRIRSAQTMTGKQTVKMVIQGTNAAGEDYQSPADTFDILLIP